MKWSEGEIAEFRENGYRLVGGLLDKDEVQALKGLYPGFSTVKL